MNFTKAIVFSIATTLFLTGYGNKDLCLKYNNQLICPTPESKVSYLLSTFSNTDLNNDSVTQITCNNHLAVGDYMNLSILPGFDGYMSIISINNTGKRTQVFPNKFTADNFVEKDKLTEIFNKDYKLQAVPPLGLEYFVVVVTKERALFDISTKNGTFDAFSDDKTFKKVLENIKSGKHGKYYLKLLLCYTHQKEKK